MDLVNSPMVSHSWVIGDAMTALISEMTPMQQKTLAELAFDQIARRIVSGAIPPSTRLVEADLARELEISRAPVREALAELVRQGLAYDVVRRGVFVKPWTKRDLWEVATLAPA
jgi:DNA-binding GntR family transcriptional regulator